MTPEPEHYDVVVVGSGEGGRYLAWHMAQDGRRTAVVERRWIGGSCPNINCLPTKNEIWSAGVAHIARRAGAFGVTTGPISVDMADGCRAAPAHRPPDRDLAARRRSGSRRHLQIVIGLKSEQPVVWGAGLLFVAGAMVMSLATRWVGSGSE